MWFRIVRRERYGEPAPWSNKPVAEAGAHGRCGYSSCNRGGTMKALTQHQVDYCRHNGFLFPVPALTPSEVATCLAGLARLESDLGSPVAEADVKWRSHAYAHSPWFNDLVRHPRILDAVEDVIGPNILVWTSTFFIKEPHSPTFAAWHQDGAYFGLEPREQVCAWVALTDATAEAGCMEQLSFRGVPRAVPAFRTWPRTQHQPCRPDHHGAIR